jgi:predicted dehydrogenase
VTTDYVELLDSGKVDAVLVSTPHLCHPEVAIGAFERNIHVLVEKPVAITVGRARAMNEAHGRSKSVFTVHFQNRHEPKFRWIRGRIAAGLVGRIHKVNVTLNHWYRPQAYYDSGTWRGKWSSEGGGVMMNQCPHDLDLFCWWLGLPKKVDARIWLGRCHDIEVEDEIFALMTFEGGGIGIMNSSTCDFPGPGRWDILGENGAIMIDGDEIKALRRYEPLSSYTATTKDLWVDPKTTEVPMKLQEDAGPTGSESCWLNFLAAIRGEEPLIMDGEEGALSVELANAVIASGFLGRPVELPLDAGLYELVLAQLRAGESGAALSPQRGRKSV